MITLFRAILSDTSVDRVQNFKRISDPMISKVWQKFEGDRTDEIRRIKGRD